MMFSADDAALYVGYLFIAYSTGWVSGYLIYIFRRFADNI